MNRLAMTSSVVLIFAACDVGAPEDEHALEAEGVGKGDVIAPEGDDPPTGVDLVVHGVNLQVGPGVVVEGRLHAGLEGLGPISTATVGDDEAFTLTFPGQFAADSFGMYLTVYFDVDGDGACGVHDLVRTSFVPTSFTTDPNTVEVIIDYLQPVLTEPAWCEDFVGFEPAEDGFDCASTCENRVEGTCFSSCESFCVNRIRSQSEEVRDAFATCVETNPLCFMSIEQCVGALVQQ